MHFILQLHYTSAVSVEDGLYLYMHIAWHSKHVLIRYVSALCYKRYTR